MQTVYKRKQNFERRYENEPTGLPGRFLLRIFICSAIVFAIFYIKHANIDIFDNVKTAIERIVNSECTFDDIINGAKEYIRFFKQLILK